jgi:hypothetical protein
MGWPMAVTGVVKPGLSCQSTCCEPITAYSSPMKREGFVAKMAA